MNVKSKFEKVFTILVCFVLVFSVISDAHSGRTDGSGGHKDNKNKSGLGYYHYHHGYSAHLHPNGVCPYSVVSPPSTNNNSVSSSYSLTTKNKETKYYIASLPELQIKLNDIEIENHVSKYPVLFYNDIAYIPLTWNFCKSIGVDIAVDIDGNVTLSKNKENSDFIDLTESTNENEFNVENFKYNILFEGKVIADENYPNIFYRDIAYVPLTWNNCNDFFNLSVTIEDNKTLSLNYS